jgi:LPXTG-motif cell wall-anchored protein
VVAFTAPTSDGGSAITGYEYRLDGGAWVPVGSTSSPFTITGLTNGTSYQVELRAVNGVGPGPVSAPVTVTPAAPATTVPVTTAPVTSVPATTVPGSTVPVDSGAGSQVGGVADVGLPATGGMWGVTVVWAFVLLVVGGGLFGARRRALHSNLTDKKS